MLAPRGGRRMEAHLVCHRCGATLAPAFAGLRCPRLTACGKGGYVEASSRRPPLFLSSNETKADA